MLLPTLVLSAMAPAPQPMGPLTLTMAQTTAAQTMVAQSTTQCLGMLEAEAELLWLTGTTEQ